MDASKPFRNMRLSGIICIFLLVCGACCAEDLIFFADDHYKAVGSPLLNASIANPVFEPGDSLLRITLANGGRLEELMPISGNGSKEDVSREMLEEMHSVDALNINASLDGLGPLAVISGPKTIDTLPAGEVTELQFNLSIESGANGWYELPLRLDYERQVDVSVSGGEVSPLYLPENLSTSLRVLIQGPSGPLKVLGTKSELVPGSSGTIMAVIKNDGQKILRNCSARLMATPPFHAEGSDYSMGDLPAGALAVASFQARVDGNASLQDYQLGCEVSSQEGQYVLAMPLALTKANSALWSIAIPISLVLIIVALATFLLLERRGVLRRKRWVR
jgi:hypothetical protein